MSLLSPDRIIVGLSPFLLQALHVRGRLRPHVAEKHDQQFQPSDTASWNDTLKTLENLLAKSVWNSGKISVVLSNHWVRYVLVPGKRNFSSAQQNALAAIVFEKTYGQISLDWEIRTSLASSEGTMVASGIPKALLEAIRALCGKRLGSIRPFLMPVANTAIRFIKNDTGRLVIAEPGRITFALIQDGQWQSISSRAISASNESVSLKRILDEDLVLQHLDSNGLLWFCKAAGNFDLPTNGSGVTKHIEPRIFSGKSSNFSLANWGINQ